MEEELREKIRRKAYEVLRRSVFVLHVDSGSCNGCDIEVIDALTPYFDVERFGIKVVASPKHADVLLVTGPVTRQFKKFLVRVYEYTPKPCVVIACGSCACGGGIWYDTYSVEGGVDKVVPVNVYVPGCPPRPSAILHGVLVALGVLEEKMRGEKLKAEPERYRVHSIPVGGLLRDYELYRRVLLKLKAMLGYRLAYRVMEDYVLALTKSSTISELREKCKDIASKWSNDPRIVEVLEEVNKVVEEYVSRGC